MCAVLVIDSFCAFLTDSKAFSNLCLYSDTCQGVILVFPMLFPNFIANRDNESLLMKQLMINTRKLLSSSKLFLEVGGKKKKVNFSLELFPHEAQG